MKKTISHIINKVTRVRIVLLVLAALVASVSIQGQKQKKSKSQKSNKEVVVAKTKVDTIEISAPKEVDTDTLLTDTLTNDTLPWPLHLANHFENIIKNSHFLDHSQMGMMVYDITADSVLFTHNHHQTMRPASTMKLLTAITALDKLGGEYQFKTQMHYKGEIIDSLHTLKGDIYLVGGMDPMFGRKDLLAFIDTLKALNIDTIRGNIYADKSMKDTLMLGEGWCWDDENPVLTPNLYQEKDEMAVQFVKELGKKGITIRGSAAEKTLPSKTEMIAVCKRSIDDVLQKMMKDSDNLYAESMFYQILNASKNASGQANRKSSLSSKRTSGSSSPKTSADEVKVVMNELIEKIGFTPSNYRIADGSGLSLYNYLSPELEVGFLLYAYKNEAIYSHLLPALPIAGVDGTLSKRMKKTSATYRVNAKTGTVTGVSCLAGYAKARNGHLLAFSIMNQGELSSAVARMFQDKICVAMCR